ncbi:uncharacterized protein LOC114520012 [Dendronephthya gigantea]|uniref:uncharacterized protein LOC114520012 n=1 Tax=Dendronephthya gigantea TaxID=151771 RepID=UPI00106ACD84|nr:uncharacterized protein LOC114520012 [Dendronephthya gigantea]XP_028396019.1 uncharacterized protein LOC114520012 [Dendronephthya gigantea]XP_028396026.1 uncharacterized protein LOC114520012 [Dendronephthya gigantea]
MFVDKWLTFHASMIAIVCSVHVYADEVKKCYCSNKYGITMRSPGHSCEEILQHHAKRSESRSNGIYWISLEERGSRNIENAFPVFCDMQVGGWTLVFKTVSGEPLRSITSIWNGTNFPQEFSTAALNKNADFKIDYKNRIANFTNWRIFGPKEARVVLYKNGEEQMVMRFNASSSTYLDWFSQQRLLESPWNDLASSTPKLFVINGLCIAENECRAFQIIDDYETCEVVVGWLVLSSLRSRGCELERRFPGNSFIFSKLATKVNYTQYNDVSGDSDVFAVYVR